MDADAAVNAAADANADAGVSTIALRERCSGELKSKQAGSCSRVLTFLTLLQIDFRKLGNVLQQTKMVWTWKDKRSIFNSIYPERGEVG